MPEYTGPEELPATSTPAYGIPAVKQMGGLEPFESDEPMVRFLYLLMRDSVQPGHVEQLVCEVERTAERGSLLSNAYLAEYANNISERLIRATELRMKAQGGELRQAMTGGMDVPAPASGTPLSEQAEVENEESREEARVKARAAAEGRLRAWVNAPMTIPLARVIEQAFAAIGTAEELADLGEVLETVTILTDFALPEGDHA